MDLKDMILVTENDRGTETNMLMTLDDYKSFIAVDDMSELAENLLQLGRTLGEADNFTEYYRAANVTVSARFCLDDIQLGHFLQGFYNDSKEFRFDKEASSSECVAKLKEIGMTDKAGWMILTCIMKVWTDHLKGDRHFITSMTMITWCLKHYHQGISW